MTTEAKSRRKIDWDSLPLLLTPKDLLDIWPGGKNSVYALFHRQGFPSVRHGKRLFVSRDALKAWLEKGGAL